MLPKPGIAILLEAALEAALEVVQAAPTDAVKATSKKNTNETEIAFFKKWKKNRKITS